MKTHGSDNRIDTTLGELIATVSDVAFEYSDDAKEAYHLARLILVELLKGTSTRKRNHRPALSGTTLLTH